MRSGILSACGERDGSAERPSGSASVRICAHRGLSEVCPENTLPAFGAAVAVGSDEVEFDLRLSRDGVPVVCHDAGFARTAGGGPVGELSWEEIRRLDAGVRWGEGWRGVGVPCLEDVLACCGGRTVLNIHVKEAGSEGVLVRRVCERLRGRGLTDSAYIAGCTPEVLGYARDCAPEIERACLLSQGDPGEQVRLAVTYGCSRVQFGRHVSDTDIAAARERGLTCNLFWSDDPDDARQWAERGIDVILTNRAHQLLFSFR